jgi:hypothetical protein
VVARHLRKPFYMKKYLPIRGSIALAAMGCALSLVSSPALAQAGASIPEPSNIALFCLGVLGLILGRHGGRSKPRD